MKKNYHFMFKNKILIFFVIILLLVITMNIFSAQEENPAIQLEPVEIREYQGERLSSLNDFNDNAIKGTQRIEKDNYFLKITGLIQEEISYSYNEVIENFKHYKKIATLDCVEGWIVKVLWEGVLVKDLIGKENVTTNAKIIIFHAQDGYTTSFPIEYIFENNILLAFKANEIVLPQNRGFPFMLVAESKWGYKWIKWVIEIELSDDENYKGFWESRGYSNDGDIKKSYFEQQ